MLKVNRKDAPSSASTFVLWSGCGNRCLDGGGLPGSVTGSVNTVGGMLEDASNHASISSSMSTTSKINSTQTLYDAANGSTADEEVSTSDTVYVAVFAQGSGKVWGSASSTLHDAMDDCARSGDVLVVIPSYQYQSAYSSAEAERVLGCAQKLVC